MKVKVGFKLWGTIDIDLDQPTRQAAEERLLGIPAATLINAIEGMPADIEGDAIEVVSLEPVANTNPSPAAGYHPIQPDLKARDIVKSSDPGLNCR
jgi:hypothetical protein